MPTCPTCETTTDLGRPLYVELAGLMDVVPEYVCKVCGTRVRPDRTRRAK